MLRHAAFPFKVLEAGRGKEVIKPNKILYLLQINLYMKSLFASLILVLTSLSAIAQSNIVYNNEYINHIDDKGNKQGVWKLYDNKRKLEVIT